MNALWRRLRSITAFAVVLAVLLVAWPLIATVAALRDVVRGTRFGATRFVGVIVFYALMEAAGLLAALGMWLLGPLVSKTRYLNWHHGFQTWWASWLLRFLLWIYAVNVRVEGADNAADGPYLLLMRHASMGDTLVPIRFVQAAYGMHLRYVLKAELLWEPCIDIVGNRIPNVFVERGSKNPERQRLRVAKLGADLGPRDGVVMFPEGTRFSASRRERVIARLEAQGEPERAGFARSLRHVLPPRHGGVAALLRIQPGLDVVFGAHHGFDGATRLPDLMSGDLVGRTVDIAFWRVSTADLNLSPDTVGDWLDEQWRAIDQWVAERSS